MAVLIYNTNKGSYTRFGDGSWMSNNKRCSQINKLYYIPRDYNFSLDKDILKDLDKDIIANSRNSGGKLVEIVFENVKEEIIVRGVVNSIEKIGL